jgi:putative membrane protein
MLLAKLAAFLVGAIALAAASLADAQPKDAEAQAAVAVQSPQFFVTQTGQANLLVIQSSQLAIERAQTDHVKALANLFLEDHRKIQFRMRDMAEKAQLKIPHELEKTRQAELEGLRNIAKGEAFDRAWVSLMSRAQQEELLMFAAYAKKGDHKDLKDWAGVVEPVLRDHLRRVQQLPSK